MSKGSVIRPNVSLESISRDSKIDICRRIEKMSGIVRDVVRARLTKFPSQAASIIVDSSLHGAARNKVLRSGA